jgi:hypothetical protein
VAFCFPLFALRNGILTDRKPFSGCLRAVGGRTTSRLGDPSGLSRVPSLALPR